MSSPYNFFAMDGGDRCPNGLTTFYNTLGITADPGISIGQFASPASAQYMFGYSVDNPANLYFDPIEDISTETLFATSLLYLMACDGKQKIYCKNANGNAQFYLQFNAGGSVSVYSGSALLGTSATGIFVPPMLFTLDISAVVSEAEGAVTLWLNGKFTTPILTISGANTAADTDSLPLTNFVYVLSGMAVRDMVGHDGTGPAPFNAPLGPVGLVWRPGATLVSGGAFTANGLGTLVANLAGTPNPYVDFDSSATVGDAMTVGVEALPSNVLEVLAVAPVDYSYRTDTSGTRALQKTLISADANVVGTENYLNATATVNQDPWIFDDPTTDASLYSEGASAITVVNAMQIKLEVAA